MERFYNDDFTGLEQLINYRFKNSELICEALSHPSLKQHESDWRKN
jgi:dsRNA-specific ribonuclease